MTSTQINAREAVEDVINSINIKDKFNIVNDNNAVSGQFVLAYSRALMPYIVSYEAGVLKIIDIKRAALIAQVECKGACYTFPMNPTNIPQTRLIALAKVMRFATISTDMLQK